MPSSPDPRNAVPFRCEGAVDPSTGLVEVRSVDCEGMPEMEQVLRERLRSLRRWSFSAAKLRSLILLVFLASILAASYGASHNQLSYTVAPEYFTKIKFPQLEIALETLGGPRQGAAFVGGVSTWWVGAGAGVLLGLIGMIHPERSMFRRTFRALLFMLATAFVFGLIGLGLGMLGLGDLFAVLGGQVEFFDGRFDHPTMVLAVRTMHWFSYFGGFLGLLIGLADIRRVARPVFLTV